LSLGVKGRWIKGWRVEAKRLKGGGCRQDGVAVLQCRSAAAETEVEVKAEPAPESLASAGFRN